MGQLNKPLSTEVFHWLRVHWLVRIAEKETASKQGAILEKNKNSALEKQSLLPDCVGEQFCLSRLWKALRPDLVESKIWLFLTRSWRQVMNGVRYLWKAKIYLCCIPSYRENGKTNHSKWWSAQALWGKGPLNTDSLLLNDTAELTQAGGELIWDPTWLLKEVSHCWEVVPVRARLMA